MKIRTKCPKNNKYYIRTVTGGLNGAVAGEPTQRYANVLDNCVGYANGRFNEIWNDPDLKGIVKAFHVQLTCNAENFIESAKRQGLKISSTPVVGGIMVWQKGGTLSGNDGAGHVAVVERVYDDGTILTSESGWASWAFKTVRRDNSNGRWGQNSLYKFRGCIINPNVKNTITPAPKLTIDGVGGACTVRAMQRFFGTVQDGVISGQSKAQNKYYPALKAVEYGTGGSTCIKKLQKWVGTSQDGVLGENTVKAWQKKIGVASDGVFGVNSMKAWQKYLNEHEKAVYPIEKSTIGSLANEYAYTTNTSTAKYNGGAPTEAYKNGLDKAYPNRSSWGTAPRKGASCDVFVGTCVRNAGVDANFPRGLADQIPYLAKSDKFEEVTVTASTAKDGDIIIYTKTAGGGHVCIVYGGKIKEAGFESYYPKTTDTLKTRLSTKGKNWVKVYRATPSVTEKELKACKEQAEWMKNSKYKWQANPTIAKSKTYGTCVTYVACVLQRIGYLASGKCIWHNSNGKVYGATDKMTVIYPKGKILSQLKSELKVGDIIMDGNKADLESGSHIFILTGEWSGNKPIIWDNHSAQQKGGKSYVYSRDRNVIAIVRLK